MVFVDVLVVMVRVRPEHLEGLGGSEPDHCGTPGGALHEQVGHATLAGALLTHPTEVLIDFRQLAAGTLRGLVSVHGNGG